MEERMQEGAPLTAQEISGELMEDTAEMQAQEAEKTEAMIREGIAALFEDGWSGEELAALSQDEGVRADVAQGKDLVRAAAAYLKRQLAMQPTRRRGLPVSRTSAAGHVAPGNRIDEMTDAQFEAFSRSARAAAMMGRKVRM